ncbi:hypothetical protein HDU83_007076 [Entophlyctis luteolus]|nr:hypothetical protein HDU82_006710 [Entophlyctis luteolus]KAJ3340460.1 hypothetical protein HDU83_007076 [Entophlyctis luteolus]
MSAAAPRDRDRDGDDGPESPDSVTDRSALLLRARKKLHRFKQARTDAAALRTVDAKLEPEPVGDPAVLNVEVVDSYNTTPTPPDVFLQGDHVNGSHIPQVIGSNQSLPLRSIDKASLSFSSDECSTRKVIPKAYITGDFPVINDALRNRLDGTDESSEKQLRDRVAELENALSRLEEEFSLEQRSHDGVVAAFQREIARLDADRACEQALRKQLEASLTTADESEGLNPKESEIRKMDLTIEGLREQNKSLVERINDLESKRFSEIQNVEALATTFSPKAPKEMNAAVAAIESESEVQKLTDAVSSLTQDLEALTAHHYELTQTLKIQKSFYEARLEAAENSAGATAVAKFAEELEARDYTIAALRHELETQKDRFHASQAKSQSLLDALNRAESELARLRLAQADIGTTMLLKGADLRAVDVMKALQARNDDLASEVMIARQEVAGLQAEVNQLKMRALHRDAVVAEAAETRRELANALAKHARESDVWALKERSLYAATETLQREYQTLVQTISDIKKMIWESAATLPGWHRGSTSERAEDVDVFAWVEWMIDAQTKLRRDLESAHQIIDMQHEKMEAIVSSSKDESNNQPTRNGRIPWRQGSMETASVVSSSESFDVWYKNVSTLSPPLGYHSHNNPIADIVDSKEIADSGPFPASLEKHLAPEKLQSMLKKLMSRNVQLQQKLIASETQLEHQLKTNTEIKRMLVSATVGEDTSIERYNDALVEIGELRKEIEVWRSRHEEMEAVVESIVVDRIANGK